MQVCMHIYVTFKINIYWWLGSVAINNSFLWHITQLSMSNCHRSIHFRAKISKAFLDVFLDAEQGFDRNVLLEGGPIIRLLIATTISFSSQQFSSSDDYILFTNSFLLKIIFQVSTILFIMAKEQIKLVTIQNFHYRVSKWVTHNLIFLEGFDYHFLT